MHVPKKMEKINEAHARIRIHRHTLSHSLTCKDKLTHRLINYTYAHMPVRVYMHAHTHTFIRTNKRIYIDIDTQIYI